MNKSYRFTFGAEKEKMEKELKNTLLSEESLYLGKQKKSRKQTIRRRHKRYYIWKYLHYFRLCQYYLMLRNKTTIPIWHRRFAKFLFRLYEKKKNVFSYKSGVEIGLHCKIGKNCDIWHGGVVINGNLGDNCILHGNNIIGNKGNGCEEQIPVLGSNIDIGAGAIIIGGICVADESIIGAGAVVTKSFLQTRSVIVGVPGQQINT